jgi:hypothetical protein
VGLLIVDVAAPVAATAGVFTKEIEFTDFPLPEITLYFQNNTIFLPSEY